MSATALDFVDAHPPGMAGVGYVSKADWQKVLSGGQDGQLCIHQANDLSEKISKSLQSDNVACHCLAVSPSQEAFAVGDQAHFVKVGPQECSKGLTQLTHQSWANSLSAIALPLLYTNSTVLSNACMQIYKLPDGTFDSVATRFSLPVRCLAFSPSGTNLAAAGDDEGIKLISAAESKVSCCDHEATVICLHSNCFANS